MFYLCLNSDRFLWKAQREYSFKMSVAHSPITNILQNPGCVFFTIQQLVLIEYQQLNLGSTPVSLAFSVVSFPCLNHYSTHFSQMQGVLYLTLFYMTVTGYIPGILYIPLTGSHLMIFSWSNWTLKFGRETSGIQCHLIKSWLGQTVDTLWTQVLSVMVTLVIWLRRCLPGFSSPLFQYYPF